MAEDQNITCSDCGITFLHSVKDQEFFTSMNFSAPRRCRGCRQKRKAEKEAGGGGSSGGMGGGGYGGGSSGGGGRGFSAAAPQVAAAPARPAWGAPVEVQQRRPSRPTKGRKREHDFNTDE